MISLTILAPAFYTNPDWSTRYLRRSAARCDVPVHWYGSGEPFRGWVDVQITRLLAELRNIATHKLATHVLYTDSSDAILLSHTSEIITKYRHMNEPPILASQENGGLCAGGWMGELHAAITALEWLGAPEREGSEWSSQQRWREEFIAGNLKGLELDVRSNIFQVTGWDHLKLVATRIVNDSQYSQPCIVHYGGGYTDPEVGKAALIEPTWRALGYEATVEGEYK